MNSPDSTAQGTRQDVLVGAFIDRLAPAVRAALNARPAYHWEVDQNHDLRDLVRDYEEEKLDQLLFGRAFQAEDDWDENADYLWDEDRRAVEDAVDEVLRDQLRDDFDALCESLGEDEARVQRRLLEDESVYLEHGLHYNVNRYHGTVVCAAALGDMIPSDNGAGEIDFVNGTFSMETLVGLLELMRIPARSFSAEFRRALQEMVERPAENQKEIVQKIEWRGGVQRFHAQWEASLLKVQKRICAADPFKRSAFSAPPVVDSADLVRAIYMSENRSYESSGQGQGIMGDLGGISIEVELGPSMIELVSREFSRHYEDGTGDQRVVRIHSGRLVLGDDDSFVDLRAPIDVPLEMFMHTSKDPSGTEDKVTPHPVWASRFDLYRACALNAARRGSDQVLGEASRIISATPVHRLDELTGFAAGRQDVIDEIRKREAELVKELGPGRLGAALVDLMRSDEPGWIRGAQRLLDLGASPNEHTDLGVAPVHLAAYLGNLPFLDRLEKAGARIDAKASLGDFRRTAWEFAAGGTYERLSMLSSGERVNSELLSWFTKRGVTPVINAKNILMVEATDSFPGRAENDAAQGLPVSSFVALELGADLFRNMVEQLAVKERPERVKRFLQTCLQSFLMTGSADLAAAALKCGADANGPSDTGDLSIEDRFNSHRFIENWHACKAVLNADRAAKVVDSVIARADPSMDFRQGSSRRTTRLSSAR